MRKQAKVIIVSIVLCMIMALGVFCVFAIKNFSLQAGGSIKFVAPSINATISEATLTGVSKESGSGQMSEFEIKSNMTEAQVQALPGYQSWSGLKLLFDDDSDGKASISFTITNNSEKEIENIKAELSTNTTDSSSIQATTSADFCIAPKSSHTFTIGLNVINPETSATLDDFQFVVDLRVIKPSEVVSEEEHAQTTGLTFETNSDTKTAVFKKYVAPTGGALKDVEIPAYLKDENDNLYTVTEIADGTSSESAFSSIKTTLSSVTFPNTLTKIGDYAFANCTVLTGDLVIPDSVKTIGIAAFAACRGLNGTLTFGNGLISIGDQAFHSCGALTGDLIIPNSVKTIGSMVFFNCWGFTGKLTIGNSVETIGQNAFYNCNKLAGDLTFGGKLTSIATYVFYNCTKLTGNVIIPKGVTSIGANAFYGCSKLTGIVLPSALTSIGGSAFYGCSSWTGNLTLPNGVTSIADSAFSSCTKLTSITLPGSVTTIGSYVFNGCTGLTSLTIKATTPPSLGTSALASTNECPIYVPTEDYKTASGWSTYASRITVA